MIQQSSGLSFSNVTRGVTIKNRRALLGSGFSTTGGNMAIDVYLQIDGIKGESSDDRHKDWIECTSAVCSVTQPKSATTSTGGGHTAERCEHGDVVISKLADLA